MRRSISAVALCVALAGCAQNPTFQEGLNLLEAGNVEPGLAKLEEAAKADPRNREIPG